MAEVLDGSGRTTEFDASADGSIDEPNGDANPAGGEPTGNNNPSEWSSFGRNGHSGSGFSDPDTAAPGPDYSSEPAPFGRFANGKPRKRAAKGSKSGGSSTAKRDPAKEAVPLASLLFSSHFMASKFLLPELELTEDESKTMARAITEVGQYYDIPMVSPQQVAWYNLASTAAMIYGTRFVAYRNRARKEAAEKRAGNVAQISPRNFGAM